MYNSLIHHRRSIRLTKYDYSSEGLYFITLCTADRKNIFGHIIDGEMHLNSLGKIASEEWLATADIRKNISLGEFIIMPNHMHGIISIDYKIEPGDKEHIGKFRSPSQSIGAIIRGYKGATTKRINHFIREIDSTGVSQYAPTNARIIQTGVLQYAPTKAPTGKGSIWKRNYYEHIIRTDRAYHNISNYIITNPKNWKKDKLNYQPTTFEKQNA
jgi:putative transposase